ncbi:diacylglycerol kinase family lipid kinase [Desulfococcaceae bacterium HSG9]|nr:diacylglycerol kinase family lipid kinase [Desulfococcaceae bacterium HSG9]
MKIVLITNPHAGGHKSQQLIPMVKKRLRANKIAFDLFLTYHSDHVDEIIRSIKLQEYDALVAMGGDGANYHLLNAVLKHHDQARLPPLGIIPAGRGNSFARDLNLFSSKDAIDAISRRRTRPVDVCRFTQNTNIYYFVNCMGMGFVTDVARTATRFPRTGHFSYIIGVWHRMYNLNFYNLRMEIDGTLISGKNCLVEICNSRYTGGEMLMAPEAKIDDGLFDAVILEPFSRLNLLVTLPKLFKGTHVDHPRIRVIQGKTATICTKPEKKLLPDGEMFGVTPTHLTMLPRRVRYFCR